ncbi:MAG: right-handed parallel beta-helix repeat-containing protein [Desulfuromonadales bacterium]|nr:right-handed parallel beta-helix repeat-containing protein [Desulfuromonadales bacterium]
MWLRKRSIDLLWLAGLGLLLTLPAQAAELTGKPLWRGQVELTETTIVHEDAVLTIVAGTRVVVTDPAAKLIIRGRLLVQGSRRTPVVFASPAGWEGIEFMEAKPGSQINWTRFAGAKMALSSFGTDFTVANSHFEDCEFAIKLFRESAPLIVDSEFVNNQVGVDNQMKSAATIRDNRFADHGKTAIVASHGSRGEITGNHFSGNVQAIGLLQRYPDRVAGNTFSDNQVAIYCNQTQNTPLVESNLFEKNGQALINFSFAYPVVRNNRFIDNETAVRNDQYGSTVIEHNLFQGNQTALFNNRKSNPQVTRNLFQQNGLALFCDYSSYPQVANNNFVDNEMGVKLGIYQSADWEKRSGSRAIMQREAAERQSQNPLLAKAPTEFTDIVDVSDNYWGAQTSLLEAAGADGNVSIFHDRRDQPHVTYEGFGTDSYRLDKIRYAPWLPEPVAQVGPRETP